MHSLYLFKKTINIPRKPTSKTGFSLIELITVVAGIALITSIASTALQRLFKDFENDEVQGHLNSLAAECLKISANVADSNDAMPAPTSIDTNLLDKNNYVENSNNTCKYLQINPKDSNSKTHFSMGFGISYGKVTKFAIKDSANTTDIVTACEGWAGEGNCLANGSNYSAFFTHMDDVRKARATCNINLTTAIESEANPANGGDEHTWDSEADKDCKDKTLPANTSSYSTTNCTTNGCTKDVKIKGGKIVGYSDSDYNQAQTLECSNSISTYINSGSYNGGAETKTDLTGCTGTTYICNYNEHSEASYENCKIEDAISACKRDLEEKRLNSAPPSEITVSGGGLPPCGQTYCVSNEDIDGTTYKVISVKGDGDCS